MFVKWLKTMFGATKVAPSTRKRIKAFAPWRPGLEALENRLVPSTLSFSGGILTYTAGKDIANNLTVSVANSAYTFTETSEAIKSSGVVPISTGPNSVSVVAKGLSQIVLNL